MFGDSELPGATNNPIVWVQMRPDEPDRLGQRIARAIAESEKACPDIVVDGRKRQMREPVPLARHDFSPTLCELELNPGETAKIGNVELPERSDDPSHILLLGDTGCRVTFYQSQACLNRDEWPFRDLSVAAARLASQIDIDLVIHVGDYHYREHACPDWHSGCRGSPAGDNWPVWKADFFDAVRPLLLTAPWVMVRGNHENCERAGTGWLHLFDPYTAKGETKRCRDDTGGYAIRLKDKHFLIVLDTANAASRFELSDRPDTYRKTVEGVLKDLRAILSVSSEKAADELPLVWLLLHQPLWGAYDKDHSQRIAQPDSLYDEELPLEAIRQVVRIADDEGLGISAVFSGDTHMFQRFLPEDDNLPIQIVAGTGGTALEKAKDFSHIDQKTEESFQGRLASRPKALARGKLKG